MTETVTFLHISIEESWHSWDVSHYDLRTVELLKCHRQCTTFWWTLLRKHLIAINLHFTFSLGNLSQRWFMTPQNHPKPSLR